MLRLGYETMRRRADLCFLCFEDLEYFAQWKGCPAPEFLENRLDGPGQADTYKW